MITNGKGLLHSAPIEGMLEEKVRSGGCSHGLSEAGYDIRIKQELLLSESSRFALASTIERFQMPKTLVAVVHDKSTWARRGLSVFNTVIEPGWSGWLTLELVYHGQGEIHIPAGVGIAQVLFHHLEWPADYGDGKYQNQKDEPVGPISA
jgi:dCTP deaminase